MKTFAFSAATAAAFAALLAVPAPASAQSDAPKPASGRCEWQSQPQVGPRAPLRAPVCREIGDRREDMKGMGGPECDPKMVSKTGRYEWRSPRQLGPRAPLQAPVRAWVEAC